MLIPKKGDLVYLPSDITLLDAGDPMAPVEWLRLSEPSVALMVKPNWNDEDIYHKIHVKGSDWLVRTIDTMEVVSRV
jgi:hypothetical protein|tara:strand:- start:2190 stop:2420 length:231 start_codon:yes stop_codon:yes gene_type:complete